jgi:hypothetical protein
VSDSAEVVAQVSLRAGAASAAASDPASDPDADPDADPAPADPLERIRTLSSLIADTPSDDLHLARARLLLDLGETSHARRDLDAARAMITGPYASELAALDDELAERTDPTHLRPQPEGSPIRHGTILAPVVDPGSWQATAAELARLATATAEPVLAFALAEELEGAELTPIRRARAWATRATRWEPLRATEKSAGHESLVVHPGPLDDSPALLLRDALLAAPWRRPETHLLDPGEGATLAISGPRTIRIDAWCRRLWTAPSAERCPLAVRLDNAAATPTPATHGEATTLASIEVPAGEHQLEVVLGDADPAALAAVRFSEGDDPIPVARPVRVFLGKPDRPVEVVVAGPGALALELRGYAAPHDVTDVVVVGPDGERRTLALAIDPSPAPEVRGAPIRKVKLTAATAAVVTLPGRGAHTVTITPRQGTIAARLAVRVAVADVPPFEPAPSRDPEPGSAAATPLRWPSVGTLELEAKTIPRISGWVTPSVEVVVGRDDLEELDADLEPLGLRAEVAVQVRARVHRVAWYRAEVRGRQLGALAPTAVARVTGEHRPLPGALALLDLLVAAQDTMAGLTTMSRLRLRVEYAFVDRRDLQLGLGFLMYDAESNVDEAPDDADPLVASDYQLANPSPGMLRAFLRMRPFADQVATARLEARGVGGFADLDRVDGELSWRGLVELWPLRGPIANLSYRPSLRLAGPARPGVDTYWRHDLGLSLAWRLGAITVGVHGDLYLPTNGGAASAVRLVARWDLGARGRAGLDLLPTETPLADFALERSWTR